MGKRKAKILTVVESATNWFDASNHDPIAPEVPADLGNQVGVREEIVIQSKEAEAAATGPSLAEFTVKKGSAGPLAEVAPPGGLEPGGETTNPLSAEVEDPSWSTQEAFWRLLQAAGYECW